MAMIIQWLLGFPKQKRSIKILERNGYEIHDKGFYYVYLHSEKNYASVLWDGTINITSKDKWR